MPEAPVSDGTVLYYEDTGVPEESSDYLTIILIHGLSFHGGECYIYFTTSLLTLYMSQLSIVGFSPMQ